MVQSEPLSHWDVSIQIENISAALSALSLTFQTNAEDRTFSGGQCMGMQVLLDAIRSKLGDTADAIGDLANEFHELKSNAESRSGQDAVDTGDAYRRGYMEGVKFSAEFYTQQKEGASIPTDTPASLRGWTGDQPPVADQPVYPQVNPTPAAEEPGALRA